jgi:hypothetical protein
MHILADAVSDVIGARSLAYVAIKKAAIDQDAQKNRWAEMMFNQISAANRRRIHSTAVEKAHEEKARNLVGVRVSGEKTDASVEVADMRRLFGRIATAH